MPPLQESISHEVPQSFEYDIPSTLTPDQILGLQQVISASPMWCMKGGTRNEVENGFASSNADDGPIYTEALGRAVFDELAMLHGIENTKEQIDEVVGDEEAFVGIVNNTLLSSLGGALDNPHRSAER